MYKFTPLNQHRRVKQMASLRDSFDGDHDDNDAPPPAILVRPMESRDAWKMVVLERSAYPKKMRCVNPLALKILYDDMIPHTLVAVKKGGEIIGFGIASSEPGLFKNKRGVLKIVTGADVDTVDCAKRLIRGFALQAMAAGQNSLEVCVADEDLLEDACSAYQAPCTKRIKGITPLGVVYGLVFTIHNLTEHFGYKNDQNLPKPPNGPKP